MAASDLKLADRAVPGTPIGYLWGLPMDAREVLAFHDRAAGRETPEQQALLTAWLVRMTLLHGTWVSDKLGTRF